MSKRSSSKPILVLMLMGALGVGALAWYVKSEPMAAHVKKVASSDDEPHVTIRSKRRHHTEEEAQTSEKVAQQVLVPEMNGEKVALRKDKVEVPDGKDAKVFVAEGVVKDTALENVKVMGVDVRNGVAVINFGGDIDSGMSSEQEAQFIAELQKGFGQFPEVRRIEIDKEGQPLDSLGHIDLTESISVIRPDSDSEPDSKTSE